jgi:hypothetical protein
MQKFLFAPASAAFVATLVRTALATPLNGIAFAALLSSCSILLAAFTALIPAALLAALLISFVLCRHNARSFFDRLIAKK